MKTVQPRKRRWVATIQAGTARSRRALHRVRQARLLSPARSPNSFRKTTAKSAVETKTAIAAFQPKLAEHEGQAPAVLRRDHQDRRRGEMGEGAADGDVDEEQAERAVLQPRGRVQLVEVPREEERADRHRGRLGDERAEERPDRQDRGPPGERRLPAEARDAPDALLGEGEDRPRRGDRHDDDHEHRLGEVDAVRRSPRPSAIPSSRRPPGEAGSPRCRRPPPPRRRSGASPPGSCARPRPSPSRAGAGGGARRP